MQREPPNWVADFQNLQINNDRPKAIDRYHSLPLLYSRSGMKEFEPKQARSSQLKYIQPQSIISEFNRSHQVEDYIQSHGSTPVDLQTNPDMLMTDTSDKDAFEHAFDVVSRELRHSEEQVQKGITWQERDTLINNWIEMPSQENNDRSIYEQIGSDRILNEAHGSEQQQLRENNDDELARTAGELLDKVQHEQSKKFKESSFLALMRQLRDREVRVQGDGIVEVSIA